MSRHLSKSSQTVVAFSVLALALALTTAVPAHAYPSGYTGRTAMNSGGCGSCHSSSLSGTTTAVLSGPSALTPGATGTYTCVVTHTPAFPGTSNAGVNIAVKTAPDGSANAGTLAASGTGLKLSGDGGTSTSQSPTHVFAAAGTYSVTFTVTNAAGSSTKSKTVDVTAQAPAWAGTWLLPSSARASGANAFWTTDLVLMNLATETATVQLKFFGHTGNGVAGPEMTYTIPAHSTRTIPDVLSSVFGLTADWGPILVRSSVSTLAVQGHTWTASPGGGTYGQSVPGLTAAEAVGAAPKAIAGVRQDASFRTNLVLANTKDTAATVEVVLLLADGTTSTTRTLELGPYGFSQLNVATDLGVANLSGGTFLLDCPTAGGAVAAYASVIDATTADPRSILAR